MSKLPSHVTAQDVLDLMAANRTCEVVGGRPDKEGSCPCKTCVLFRKVWEMGKPHRTPNSALLRDPPEDVG